MTAPTAQQTEADRNKDVLSAQTLSKEVSSPEGPLPILAGIDLRITRGEAVAIVGPSGSGKTTLLALLAGLDEPTGGRVTLLGRRLADLDEDARAGLRSGRVGFVFQDFNLLPRLTAEENVRIAAELGNTREAQRRSREALAAVGLGNRARHLPATLSGGEQQRVAIARAFAPEPELLFADEPTGNLDAVNGERVIELLFRLQQEHRTTLVLATHDERLASRCSRQLMLDNGRLTM